MNKFQTLGKRFWASILDSLILMPVNWAVSFALMVFGGTQKTFMISTALVGLISVIYYVFMHSRYGQTLGKMALKVKVLDDSDGAINLGQAILRSLHQIIPVMFAFVSITADQSNDDSAALWTSMIYITIGVFGIADAIVWLVNDKHRALHDFIAGTIVVRTDV